jgi:TonB family protein
MKHFILILLVLIIGLKGYSQVYNCKPEAMKNFDEGNSYMANGEYLQAIASFNKAINHGVESQIYINRANAYLNLGDSCQYCNDLYFATLIKDKGSYKPYSENCIFYDTIRNIPDTIIATYPQCYVILAIKKKCTGEIRYTYLDKEGHSVENKLLQLPEYKGGDKGRMRFLANNVKYPSEALEKGIQGTVILSFIIHKDGKIDKIEIIKGIGGGCDEEAIRVVKLMPNWKPGNYNGNPVKVQFYMPIYFKI